MNSDDTVTPADIEALTAQLGRVPRGLRRIPARCECGWPAVVETEPRLPDGTPFPTFWYSTCTKLNAALSTLESEGVMREMQDRLAADPVLARQYRRAHDSYLEQRNAVTEIAEIEGFSAGGMPDRVKCLHALVGHSLAAGPGVNPFGDEALAIVSERGMWPHSGYCRNEGQA